MSVRPTLSDQEILVLIAKDDRAAFSELYDRYWQSLYQAAWNVLRDQESSMEVVQEIFIWLWDHRVGLQINSLPAYLRAAVKYKITDILRSNKARDANFIHLDELESNYLLLNDDPLELKELKALIKDMSAKLPARARLIFELSRNEQLSNREIAEKLGISEKTVENQITIAIKKLRISMGALSVWLFFL